MFSSLRSRLWLSYALIIFAVIFLTAIILLLSLLGNPAIYQQILSHLNAVQTFILEDRPDLASLPPEQMLAEVQRYAATFDVRILIYDAEGNVIVDSNAGSLPLSQGPHRFQFGRPMMGMHDASGASWLYTTSSLGDDRYLVIASERPRMPLMTILRGELFLPFIEAGVAALLLSLLVAFLLARWIGDPLQSIVAVSRQVPREDVQPLRPRGPREVRELIQAFNAMNARVQTSQKSQREFVANVSHELKTPLTSIQGFAQAILDGTADTKETSQQSAGVIYDEAGRMHRMVLDLLDLARLDAGTLELQRTPVDLPALLNNTVEKFAPQAQAAGVRLTVEAADLPPLTGDGDRLAQVLSNLVDNALKHTPDGGSITLRAAQTDSGVLVDVADTGAGIPPEAIPCIFDRFYQADPSRQGGDRHGAGLGLAIVKEIVTAHGGTISVRSTLGEGSTFTVALPLAKPDDPTIIRRKK